MASTRCGETSSTNTQRRRSSERYHLTRTEPKRAFKKKCLSIDAQQICLNVYNVLLSSMQDSSKGSVIKKASQLTNVPYKTLYKIIRNGVKTRKKRSDFGAEFPVASEDAPSVDGGGTGVVSPSDNAPSTSTVVSKPKYFSEHETQGSKTFFDASVQTDETKIFSNSSTQSEAVLPKDQCIQTPMRLSANSPRKVQLSSEIKDLKKAESSYKKQLQSDTTMEDVVRFLEKNYTQKASEHLKSQLTLLNKSPKGCRYTDEYKQLPSVSTLQRFTKKWIINPGFNKSIFKLIELRAKLMSNKEKDCIICLDEMSLKSHLFYDLSKDKIIGFQESHTSSEEIASTALVVMAREGETNKTYIETMYHYEKSKDYRLCPKLTDEHIYPNSFQKMKVKRPLKLHELLEELEHPDRIPVPPDGRNILNARPTADQGCMGINWFDLLMLPTSRAGLYVPFNTIAWSAVVLLEPGSSIIKKKEYKVVWSLKMGRVYKMTDEEPRKEYKVGTYWIYRYRNIPKRLEFINVLSTKQLNARPTADQGCMGINWFNLLMLPTSRAGFLVYVRSYCSVRVLRNIELEMVKVKGKSNCLSLSKKAQILEDSNKSLNVTVLAKKYGIAKSTVCLIKNKRDRILERTAQTDELLQHQMVGVSALVKEHWARESDAADEESESAL
nr:unnamed protein product [Callosobruchus chinensis]